MVGAVSHSLLGGIGLSRYLSVCCGMVFITPMLGAVLFAIIAALIITLISNNSKIRSDTVLSAIWAVSVALGLCLVSAIPGYAEDLNSYLFGNILLISGTDLIFMLVLDVAVLFCAWAFHSRFVAFCFHRETLALHGISVFRTELLLNVMSALAIVLMVQIAGIVLALALFTLPVAAAANLSRRLGTIMTLGILFCFLSAFLGMAASYSPQWHTGAVTIMIAAGIYGFSALKKRCAG